MYKTVKSMAQALAEARAYRDPVVEDKGFSSQQIKMAYGILNDPRYKQGNYSGAVRAIEKIAKGLSNHPDVANALRRANEEVKEALDFDYAIVDRDHKIIKLYNAGDKVHYGNILDNKKNLEKEVPKNKTPLKIVTLAPGRSRNYKVGGTVLGIGEETIEEFKKMIVTFPNKDSKNKASNSIMNMKQKLGFDVVDKDLTIKVDGKGADLNKYATDLKNFYGAKVLAVALEEVVIEDIYGKQDSKLIGTVTMVHKTSGKEIVVFDDPNVVKNKEKLGFKVQKEQKEETYQLTERDLLKLTNKTGFSKADFKTNENDNDHSLNAIMLARAFGTPQEFKDMIDIDKRHKERGSINEPDYQKRNALVKKYYPRLK